MPEDYPNQPVPSGEIDAPSLDLIKEFRDTITDSLGPLEELPLEIDETGQPRIFIGKAVNEDGQDVYAHLVDVTIDNNGQTHRLATRLTSNAEGQIEKSLVDYEDPLPTASQREQQMIADLEADLHVQQYKDEIGMDDATIKRVKDFAPVIAELIYIPGVAAGIETVVQADEFDEELGTDKPSGLELGDAVEKIKEALAKRA